MSHFTFLDHIFFFVIAVLLPGLSLLRGRIEMEDIEIKEKGKFYFANGGVLWIGAFFVFFLWYLSGREWSLLGFAYPKITGLVIALTVMFVMAYVADTFTEMQDEENHAELQKVAPILPQNYKELAQFSFLAFSAGICEEIVYRGFLVNYLYAHFIDPIWAYNVSVVFPAIIFGIVHMYQGFKSVLKISVMSLLFGTIFIFSESLLIVIVLHVLVDLLGGFIGMKMNQKAATHPNN